MNRDCLLLVVSELLSVGIVCLLGFCDFIVLLVIGIWVGRFEFTCCGVVGLFGYVRSGCGLNCFDV